MDGGIGRYWGNGASYRQCPAFASFQARHPSYLSAMSLAPTHDTCEEKGLHPQAMQKARGAIPEAWCVERASSLLKAVSDPTRLRMLAALSASELCVCDLAALTGISESAVSHQLRLLRQERLVAFRKEGRMAFYRLMDHHVTQLIRSAIEHAQEATASPPLAD